MLNTVLLQIVNSAAAGQVTDTLTTTPIPKQDTLSLLDLVMKGGFIMVPMGILSVITIYYFFERFMTIKSASKIDPNFMNNIKDMVHHGNLEGAKTLCKSTPNPVARMIEKGVARIGKPIKQIEESMEGVGKLEINRLEKNLSILMLVGRIGPILGFVGTIAGVIKIFYDISLTDNISIGVISGGLYQKMITSATGLVIGLMAFVGYFLLSAMLDKIINKMDTASVEFLDILQEPAK